MAVAGGSLVVLRIALLSLHFDGRLELIDWIDRWAFDPLTGRATVPGDSSAEAAALLDAGA